MKKSIFLFFISLSSVVFSQAPEQDDQKSIYKKIQPINLSSLGWEEEEWPNEPFCDYLNRCLTYQMNPQKLKRRRIVFRLLDSLSSPKSASHNVVHDIITTQDLHIFAGKKEGEPYLAEIVDRTKTELGKVYLYGMIGSPICDIELLQARQKIIKKLLNDEPFRSQLDNLYEKFSSSENMIISLWAQDGFLNSTQRH